MGQWFRVVNLDKKEWFDPRDLGGEARLLNLCCDPGVHLVEDPDDPAGRPGIDTAINAAGLLAFLLRRSDRFGGGDVGHVPPRLDLTGVSDAEAERRIAAAATANENVSFRQRVGPVRWCGRWATDRIAIVGDYDTSGLYHRLEDPGAGFRHIGSGPDAASLSAEYTRLVVGPYIEARLMEREVRRLREAGTPVEHRKIFNNRVVAASSSRRRRGQEAQPG